MYQCKSTNHQTSSCLHIIEIVGEKAPDFQRPLDVSGSDNSFLGAIIQGFFVSQKFTNHHLGSALHPPARSRIVYFINLREIMFYKLHVNRFMRDIKSEALFNRLRVTRIQ